MSYILDALKKLENEKQKKSRKDGMVSISGELFKDEPRRVSGNNTWKIVAVVLAASLVTFGSTWFLLKSGKGRDHARSNAVVPAAPVMRPVPPTPLPPSPVQQPPVAAPQVVAKTPVVPVQKPPTAVTPIPSAAVNSAPVASPKKQGRQQKERQVTTVRSVPEEKAASIPVAAPADIKVSGIAWQDERRARRAVINGFLMQEGGTVSGARITEIFQDRVRFSLDNNRVFEVPLTLSGFPGK